MHRGQEFYHTLLLRIQCEDRFFEELSRENNPQHQPSAKVKSALAHLHAVKNKEKSDKNKQKEPFYLDFTFHKELYECLHHMVNTLDPSTKSNDDGLLQEIGKYADLRNHVIALYGHYIIAKVNYILLGEENDKQEKKRMNKA